MPANSIRTSATRFATFAPSSGGYFREIDGQRGYPDAFVEALTKAGWLAALIPQDYGGSGLGLTEASIIMEEITAAAATPAPATARCTTWARCCGTARRRRSASTCEDRVGRAAAAVDGRDRAHGRHRHHQDQDHRGEKGERYVVNGQKVWISRVLHSDLMILLARTTPLDQVKKRSDGMSIFLVDLRQAIGHGMTVQPIINMVNHETNDCFSTTRNSRGESDR